MNFIVSNILISAHLNALIQWDVKAGLDLRCLTKIIVALKIDETNIRIQVDKFQRLANNYDLAPVLIL